MSDRQKSDISAQIQIRHDPTFRSFKKTRLTLESKLLLLYVYINVLQIPPRLYWKSIGDAYDDLHTVVGRNHPEVIETSLKDVFKLVRAEGFWALGSQSQNTLLADVSLEISKEFLGVNTDSLL